MSELSNLSHIITEQATCIRELREQLVRERRNIRDDFAMAALTGAVAKQDPSNWYDPSGVSVDAYNIADAMLEARK